MNKRGVDPKNPPIEDLQGQSYQHELGDPDRAAQVERGLKKARKKAEVTAESKRPIVLITGSTGLIGSRIVKAFASDYSVIGLDVKRPKDAVTGTEFVACDFTKDESVKSALEEIRNRHGDRIASVIHLAAYYDFSGEPSEMYERLTVKGTSRLLKELQGFQVEQFVFSSTVLVMEPAKEAETLTEASPLEDEPWDYPRSKIETENLIKKERGSIPAVILRIAGAYDEYGRAVPIAQQMSRIYEKKFESYFFPGNAAHGQPFVHLDDLVDCFRNVVERRGKLSDYETFLIAEPDLMSYKELQNEIGTLLHGEEWTTLWIPKLMAKAGAWAKGVVGDKEETFIKPWMIDLADDHYPVETSRARRKLAWKPQHRLRDTLPKIAGHLKEDPVRWYEMNKLPVPDEIKRTA